MICRKRNLTGSFVRKGMVCRTAAEWRRFEDEVRQQGRDMQNRLDPSRGG